ncbi:MAG: glycerol-3-phosphate 1-O-acyltransferase PlsY [Candidatus Omnitrophota bacterium]
MLWTITGIAISYLIGSIPTAYIFGRLLKGIDIRKFGSGNVGATNAMRVLGKTPGITVLVLDAAKGFIAVYFLGNFIAAKSPVVSDEILRIILGIACISGHNWTIFLRFKGGKGIASTLGVLIGLSMKIAGLNLILGLVILTWVLGLLFFRIVSVSSIIAGISLPVYLFAFNHSLVLKLLGIILAIFTILRHKQNIKRFLQAKEPRLF